MNDAYQESYALCVYRDIDPASVMQGISVQTIRMMLTQMGIDSMDDLPAEVYVTAFLDEFMNDSQWILKIIQGPALDYLLDIWEQAELSDDLFDAPMIWIEEEDWEYLQYLRLFGVLSYRRGNPAANEPYIIYIIKEMKDTFYFHLRSKKSQKCIEKYDRWENTIKGMMYYYGLLRCDALFAQFRKVNCEDVSFDEFCAFLKLRCTLWGFGSILVDKRSGETYYGISDAENPDLILLASSSHNDIDYKEISYENLNYVSASMGIDNRWDGISKMGTLLVDELDMNYYRATVFIKSLVTLVQNSYDFHELKDKMELVCSEYSLCRQELLDSLERIYLSVPVYELKGYSRNEYRRIQYEQRQKKKRERFTIIKGGLN